DPDPDQPSPHARLLLLDAPLVVARGRERLVEGRPEVAAVVHPPADGPVRKLLRRDEVAATELGRIEAEPLRREVHHALQAEAVLRPTIATIQTHRRLV